MEHIIVIYEDYFGFVAQLKHRKDKVVATNTELSTQENLVVMKDPPTSIMEEVINLTYPPALLHYILRRSSGFCNTNTPLEWIGHQTVQKN